MKDLYKERYELLKKGESFVLATLFNSQGSAPRTAGARMIIRKDGSILGTVGGGYLEALVIEDGKKILKIGGSIKKDYKLTGKDKGGIDMVCGGDVSVLIEYVDGAFPINLEIYKRIIKCINKGEKAFFIKKFKLSSEDVSSYLFHNGEVVSNRKDMGAMDIEEMVHGIYPRDLQVIRRDNDLILIEPVCNCGTLFIFGAGHVSQRLADLTSKIDFRTIVIDDRVEFANSERFPLAEEIKVIKNFDKCFENLSIDKDSYIVILTRGHYHDLTVLRQALKTDAVYIGMIGSRKKRKTIYRALEMDGFSMKDFVRVHNPIGLDIDAETPEEIAVSIAAELIKVRGERMR